jgi:hypothetical protein
MSAEFRETIHELSPYELVNQSDLIAWGGDSLTAYNYAHAAYQVVRENFSGQDDQASLLADAVTRCCERAQELNFSPEITIAWINEVDGLMRRKYVSDPAHNVRLLEAGVLTLSIYYHRGALSYLQAENIRSWRKSADFLKLRQLRQQSFPNQL